MSLKCVPKVWIHNIPALVQIKVWCQSGDKPLSELMMVSFLMHICVTRPQWVNAMEIIILGINSLILEKHTYMFHNYPNDCNNNVIFTCRWKKLLYRYMKINQVPYCHRARDVILSKSCKNKMRLHLWMMKNHTAIIYGHHSVSNHRKLHCLTACLG